MTYTKYKLTDAQLRRLSVIINRGRGAKGGVAADALERKGLVITLLRKHEHVDGSHRMVFDGRIATVAGALALAQARQEGW